ncbi:hypothetical protein C0J52_00358 [Blattella germanica]|nr:hypothetical protein C0J52_00358 [Blattella germanica]
MSFCHFAPCYFKVSNSRQRDTPLVQNHERSRNVTLNFVYGVPYWPKLHPSCWCHVELCGIEPVLKKMQYSRVLGGGGSLLLSPIFADLSGILEDVDGTSDGR